MLNLVFFFLSFSYFTGILICSMFEKKLYYEMLQISLITLVAYLCDFSPLHNMYKHYKI